MPSDPTVAQSLGDSMWWAFWFFGEVAFKWIPGAVIAFTGIADPAVVGPAPHIEPITHPVTTIEVARYLDAISAPGVFESLYRGWGTFVALGTFASLVFSALIIYCAIRIRQIRHQERLQFKAAAHPVAARDIPKMQQRWNRILEQGHSGSEQNWRLAILEGDIMLSELLDTLGYKGETMADKLRGVDRSDFNTVDLAWEAHRIRNKIAHEGAAHLLNPREARRVLGLYERIFREFRLIQ